MPIKRNFGALRAVHAALTDKGLINTELVLSETMIENNGYLDGRTVVIGKDRLADGGYVDTVIHEVTHFTEGSAEYKEYAEHILEQVSDERITEIAELNGIEAKTKGELIELVRSSDKPGGDTLISELVASESARLFDSDASVRRLARSNEGLARKILNRIRDFIDVLLAKTPDERSAIKQLMKQERLFEAALKMQGREYAEKHFTEIKREAEKEVNSQTSENFEGEQTSNTERTDRQKESAPKSESAVQYERKGVNDIDGFDADTYKIIETKVNDAIDKAIKGKGQIEEKYNQIEISKCPQNLVDMVNQASKEKIGLERKRIAINVSDIWHEYQRHKDNDIEVGRKQIAMSQESIKEAVMAIYSPDLVETIYQTGENPTQRRSFAYAKKSKDGYYVVVEVVGGRKNPNITPKMIVCFHQNRWQEMLSEGKTIGEMLYEKDLVKLDALDIEFNKNNRVTAAQFASSKAIADTPHSPRYDNSIPDSEEKSNTFSENSSKNSESEVKNDSGAQYSRKKSSDTITMSRGEAAKRDADYESDRVYSKGEVAEAVKKIEGELRRGAEAAAEYIIANSVVKNYLHDSIVKKTKDNALGTIMQLKQYFRRIRMTPTLKAEIKHRFDDKSKGFYSVWASAKDDAISPDRALSELNDSLAGLYGFPLDTSNEADILFAI